MAQGWTEWNLVKAAVPRFDGQIQPNVPLWGYDDEADPNVMVCRIDAAGPRRRGLCSGHVE